MQIFMPLSMTLNCELHYGNYVSSMSKVRQRGMASIFRSQVICVCLTLN